jgi:signal transduction histidine kinase
MNRLWVRISFSFTIVVIFTIVLPLTVGIAIRFNTGEPLFSQEQIAEFRQGFPERYRDAPGTLILRNLTTLIITVTILGIMAGMLSARGLIAPISNLAKAARAIGGRDLSQRVEVRGSQEIQDLAKAFNEMADELQQAETLRRNLLADVAHELRTPITVIQGNLQAILDDVYELDKTEIAQLYDQTRQLSRLVDDLRELAQAEARQLPLEITKVDMVDLLEDATSVYTPIAEAAGIELELDYSEGLPPIRGDCPRLTQCLQNLLNNAIRFTPQGGKVSMTLTGNDKYLDLKVSDTGSGIAPEHLPHVFDRFYRSDPNRTRETGGTGLGLAITRAIIQAHGGEIDAHSDGKGLGSIFSIKLPVI